MLWRYSHLKWLSYYYGEFIMNEVNIVITFVWHLEHTVRWQILHCIPHGPKMEKRVRRQRKHTLRFSTSSLICTPTGKLSSSALVITDRIWTISSKVNESRSSACSIQVRSSINDLFQGPWPLLTRAVDPSPSNLDEVTLPLPWLSGSSTVQS